MAWVTDIWPAKAQHDTGLFFNKLEGCVTKTLSEHALVLKTSNTMKYILPWCCYNTSEAHYCSLATLVQ